MARQFTVERLSDEFGQYLLYLTCGACAHERRTSPQLLAHVCGWDALLRDVLPRLRCSKCGARQCRSRVSPISRPRGQPPSH